MTDLEKFDAGIEDLRERIAARKTIAILTEKVMPRTQCALRRPDSVVPHCGHASDRHIFDYYEPDNLMVRCEFCTVEHYGSADGAAHWDPRLFCCIVCGSTESLTPLIVRVHLLEPLDASGGVVLSGQLETVPVVWACSNPRHEQLISDPIWIDVKRWSGNAS
ncbi:MAG: hypothetical protein M3R02_24875 [Chloroflexota bacterium]|nr:hypothetical protein [Chloroflexota bacterium]